MRQDVQPGKLDYRAKFYSPKESKDKYAQVRQDWTERFTRWCGIKHKSMGEKVQADRLTGISTVELWVRLDADTRSITSAWKATINGVDYNIRGFEASDKYPGYGFALAQSGVAI